MPFYGDSDLFNKAVMSVIAQSDPRWTLTVIDDAYPDLVPGQWLTGLDDSRITYIRNVSNEGVSATFRKCVELSSADYTVIMGCDDVMLPTYVATVKEIIHANPSVDVIQPGVDVIDELGFSNFGLTDKIKALLHPRSHRTSVLKGEKLISSLARGNWAYFPSLVWKTSTLKTYNFRADFEVVLDLSLLFEIGLNLGKLAFNPLPVFQYRRHTKSVSSITAFSGSRFNEESQLFTETAIRTSQLGWKTTTFWLRLHLTSRLHALLLFPRAVKQAGFKTARVLLNHAFGK